MDQKIKGYKALARKRLVGNYGVLIGAQIFTEILFYALAVVVLSAFGSAIAFAVSGTSFGASLSAVIFALLLIVVVIVFYLIRLGSTKLYLNFCRNGRASFKDLFYAFRRGSHPFRCVALAIVLFFIQVIPSVVIFIAARSIAALALGIQDMIASAIVAVLLTLIYVLYISLKFLFASFVLIDRPGTKVSDALKRSSKFTKKKKLKLLWLFYFSFLPWAIIGAMTYSIALLWILPYMQTTICLFYLRAEEEIYPEESYIDGGTENIRSSGTEGNDDVSEKSATNEVRAEKDTPKDSWEVKR